eukprot:7009860-Pyramimonas_sp.AAC.1
MEHDTCDMCANVGAAMSCERSQWGLRWSSLWGYETCEGCTEMGAVWCHASAATGAYGGAFCGATKRVSGVPQVVRCHASAAAGALGGAPHGATKHVMGVPTWARWCPANTAT